MAFTQIITVTLNPAIDRILEVQGLRPGAHQLVRQRCRVAAGKGVNISRALSCLGLPSIATGLLGRQNQDFYLWQLRTSGAELLSPQFVAIDGGTRENLTLIDTSSGQVTHLRDVGPTVSPEDLVRLREKLDGLAGPAALIVFSGGMPQGMTARQLEQLAADCISRGAAVAVDTSGAALSAVRELPLFLVKPNEEELAYLLGRAAPTDDAALAQAALELARRHQHVLISLAQRGVLAAHDGQVLTARAQPPPRITSNVGCGDCLLAGFIAGLTGGPELPSQPHVGKAGKESGLTRPTEPRAGNPVGMTDPTHWPVRLGVAAATANLSAPTPAQLDKQQVLRLASGVEVTEAELRNGP